GGAGKTGPRTVSPPALGESDAPGKGDAVTTATSATQSCGRGLEPGSDSARHNVERTGTPAGMHHAIPQTRGSLYFLPNSCIPSSARTPPLIPIRTKQPFAPTSDLATI